MKVRDAIKLVQADGWTVDRIRGSHRQFRHPTKPGTVTISGKESLEIPRGTMNSILKQAGLKEWRMRYVAVIEKGESSWGAHVPDFPGCVAVGESREEVVALIREAIDLHIDSLRANGEPVPNPSSEVELIETNAA